MERLLKLEDKNCSNPTIQKIMERYGEGSRYQMLLKSEEQHLKENKQLSQEQIKSIEKATHCFKQRQCGKQAQGSRKNLHADSRIHPMIPLPSATPTEREARIKHRNYFDEHSKSVRPFRDFLSIGKMPITEEGGNMNYNQSGIFMFR